MSIHNVVLMFQTYSEKARGQTEELASARWAPMA